MLDKKLFATIIATFSNLYGKNLNKETIDVYYNLLKNYSDDQIKTATENILKTHVFATFPAPAIFIKYIEKSESQEALEAWEEVHTSIRRGKGGYTDNQVSNKVILGLGNLRDLESDQVAYIANRFLGLYKDIAPKHKTENILKIQHETEQSRFNKKEINNLIGELTK
jgi:hypothetical protein